MKFHITNAKPKNRARVKILTKWALKYLIGERRCKNIKVSINFCTLDHKRDDGRCTWDDKNIKPRMFLIDFNKTLSKKELDKSILHECVHVMQFYSGKLSQDIRSGEFRWNGKIFPIKSNTYDAYKKLPWEKEAYAYQKILYKKMKKELQ